MLLGVQEVVSSNLTGPTKPPFFNNLYYFIKGLCA